MANIFSAVKNFFLESNRWKHLIGGFIVAICTLNIIYGLYAAIVAGLCLEYKDKAHNCKWDWIDFACTALGGIISSLLIFIFGLIF